MSRDEVCRGLPKTLMSELTILCKPGAHTGNMLIMTVLIDILLKPAKTVLSKFDNSLLCMHIILKVA